MGYGEGGSSNGAIGDHGSKDDVCFVATACYGENDNITDSLRRWRDEVLATKHWGKKAFIKLYYAVWGRPGGWLVRSLPFLKPTAMKMILFFMKINRIKVNKK